MTPIPIHEFNSLKGRVVFTILGSLLGAAAHTLPLMLIVFFAVMLDAITAWRLSLRLKRAGYTANGRTASGKFRSQSFGRVLYTLWLVFSLIYLAGLIEMYPVFGVNISLSSMVMMAVCFWQVWSILENESSFNDAKWAKFLQRIMIDKTSRHLDIDLDQVFDKVNKG